jgi:cytochrome c-type protein NapB
MRGSRRAGLSAVALAAVIAMTACGRADTVRVPGEEGAVKSTARVRAERRAYDGAPPTVPHADWGMACGTCHDARGMSVDGVGFAPASPHEGGPRQGATQRCTQCHVFVVADGRFVESTFGGLAQDLRVGARATPGAPPTIPHRLLMRENCVACHDGPGAREEIRTSHPERRRCRQCHVPVTTRAAFQRVGSVPETGIQP